MAMVEKNGIVNKDKQNKMASQVEMGLEINVHERM